LNPVMLATAAALLGVAVVELHQDTLFLKRGGHGPTAWHADLWTAPLATNHFVTAWLPLHRVEAAGAPLFFRTGSHRHPRVTIDCFSPDVSPADLLPGDVGEHHAPLEEGDATWHHGWTIHGAPPVREATCSRLAYAVAYYSCEPQNLGT